MFSMLKRIYLVSHRRYENDTFKKLQLWSNVFPDSDRFFFSFELFSLLETHQNTSDFQACFSPEPSIVLQV